MEISIIIPVHNEEQSIAPLLDRLNSQTFKPSEIVITDACSTDRTAAIIEAYDKGAVPVRLIRTSAAFPGRGRNLAAAQATNQWLAFIDAGTIPENTWLESLAQAVKIDTDVVYGTYEPITDSRFKVCAVMAYVAPSFEIEEKQVRPCSIVSALMKRSVWEAVGGFPEHLRSAEDLLFMRKIDRAGFRIVRAPEALVHWQVEPNAWKTFKRFVRYARSNMRAGLWSEWQLPLFKRYGLLLLSFLPAIVLGVRWLLIPIVLWLLLLGARAIVNLRRNRARYPASVLENVTRAVVLAAVLALLDLATLIGTLQWLVTEPAKSEPVSAHLTNRA